MSHRNTRQRTVILEALQKGRNHPTASELYDLVRRRLPRISLGTVYRNLEILVQAGVVQKIDSGGGQARFDGNPGEHLHVRCVSCGGLGDIPASPGDMVRELSDRVDDFEILGFRLEYDGICASCAKSRPSREKKRSPLRTTVGQSVTVPVEGSRATSRPDHHGRKELP